MLTRFKAVTAPMMHPSCMGAHIHPYLTKRLIGCLISDKQISFSVNLNPQIHMSVCKRLKQVHFV